MAQSIDPEVRERLGLEGSGRRRWLKPVLWIAALALLLAGFLVWRARGADDGAPSYVTAPVERGDLTVTVTATGTLEALDTVEVGSEVSGRVLAVHVDFNDRVTAGQILATLDPEQARARADEASAQVAAASAGLVRAQATAAEAQQNLARTRRLAESGVLSSQELDGAEATAQRSAAEVASARAQASVAQASLVSARSALEKTAVRSPIDGVVLARSVEPGQTVAASLQAPVLFTLARDLGQMTLHVDVDEADVGKVREGAEATFTVDAHPGREFPSQVVSLRNVATTDQNVVTYEAVLAVENRELLLRPGMTATAMIQAERKADVLLVPNAALRFTPPEVTTAEGGGPRGGLFIPGVTRNPWRGTDQRRGQNAARQGGAPGQGGGAAPGGGQRPGAAGPGGGGRQRAGAPGAAPGGPGAPGGPRDGAPRAGGGPAGAAVGRPGGGAGAPGAGGPGGPGGWGGGGGERVWVLRAGKAEAVWVTSGATDGQRTEVDGQLQPGDEVIVDLAMTAEAR
jgi:HlyD family secretion protein